MSNNAPDYEDNLVFPPQEIKSQDDLNQDDRIGRTMTLLKAIEQLEKTEVELEKVEKQLEIAVDALEEVVRTVDEGFSNCDRCGYEMDCKGCWCGHDAQNALDKIRGLDK